MNKKQDDLDLFETSDEKKHKKKKLWLIPVIILGVIVILIALFFIMEEIGKSKLTNSGVKLEVSDEIEDVAYEEDVILYKDAKYKYNENISTVLCIGIDKDNLNENEQSYGINGQADAVYLVAADLKEKKIDVIGIPRDTITDIELFSSSGIYLGTEKRQICLAYAYGDGAHKSCQNMATAVSRFFYGLPINSYFAIDTAAIPKLNDAVGYVTVTPNETLNAAISGSSSTYNFEEGKEITLKGRMALSYLRTRNGKTANSSYLRMERQLGYLRAFADKAVAQTKVKISTPVSLYNLISKDSCSDFGVDKLTYIVSSLFSGSNGISLDFHKVTGEITVNEKNLVEIYADEEQLFELILDVFYNQVG